MMVGNTCLSLIDHKTAIKNEGRQFSSPSRLAKNDDVTEQKPSKGINARKT
jgi:hypothetical protein